MADTSPQFGRVLEIALKHYNATATTPLTRDQASPAIILGLESLISANAANIGTITDPV